MKKYFGILNSEKVKNLDIPGHLDFLIDNELFYVSHAYSIEIEDAENPKVNLKPTKGVIDACYDYLKELLKRYIDLPFLHFFNHYNENIYGLEKQEARKIALQQFNERYKKIKVLEASFIRREQNDNGVEQIKNMNRFDFLKARQNGEKQQLATTENILQFLNGNDTYFNSEQFKNDSNTKQFIDFETNLKILISLNAEHQFEDDYQFSDLGQLKDLYEKYRDNFQSLEVFIYTHKKIQNFKENKPAQITSLFVALFEKKFIPNSKIDFMKYVNLEHQMSLTKLKSFLPNKNIKHEQRVTDFKSELQEIPSKR